MRVEKWNPNRMDQTFENIAVDRLEAAGEVLAAVVRRKAPIGTRSRPMYKSGRYAGQSWTARDAGRLKKSVRVVRKKLKSGKAFSKKRNVRVYAGHFLAYYAAIVERATPFMRTGLIQAIPKMKSEIGAK